MKYYWSNPPNSRQADHKNQSLRLEAAGANLHDG